MIFYRFASKRKLPKKKSPMRKKKKPNVSIICPLEKPTLSKSNSKFLYKILARLSTPESTSGSVTDAMAGLMKPILSNPTTQPQPPSSPTAETPEIDSKPSESVTTESKTPDEEESSQPPAKKQKKKCGVCKKKLGLTGKSNMRPPIEGTREIYGKLAIRQVAFRFDDL